MTVFIKGWDETNPAGTRSISLGDNDIRDFKYAMRERLAEDHNFFSDESGQTNVGLHKKISLINIANPTVLSDAFILFAKDYNAKSELHSMSEDNNVSQLSYLGKLWISGLKIAAEINKDLIRFDGSIWNRYSWATLLTDLQTDLALGGTRNSFSNLRVIRLSATQVQVTADELTLANTSNNKKSHYSVNVTGDITVSGANGLDTGVEAISTWYAVWVISDGTTPACLLSTSFTAPTMPAGYTYKSLVGSVRNGADGNFVDFTQNGNRLSYKVEQTIASGNADQWTSIDISSVVPGSISTRIFGTIYDSADSEWAILTNNNSLVIPGFTTDANQALLHTMVGGPPVDQGLSYYELEVLDANTVYYWGGGSAGRAHAEIWGYYLNL